MAFKKRKFSLSDRINFYGNKANKTKNKNVRAECIGFIDGANGDYIDSSIFSSDKEKESYYKGVDRGNKAKFKSTNLKW